MARRDFVTRRLFDPQADGSISGRARGRRWEMLMEHFPELADMRVLDLGGTPPAWRMAPVKPAHVTTVNLRDFTVTEEDENVTAVLGDACHLPDEVVSRSFDLVLSNSLLEHVGGHAMRERLGENVRKMAPHHWVQTPYRYFPVEPHWLFPGMQFLPHSARVQVSLRWNRGHIKTYTYEQAVIRVDEVELVSVSQMSNLFPQSRILRERFAGLTKSLVAMA